MIYYLSLGSNLGDKIANLQKAVHFLEELGDLLKTSSIYETEPVGMDVTEEEVENFYNQVLCFQTNYPPAVLLKKIKAFEKRMGRDISRSHNLPRTIDIDILLAGNRVVNSSQLVIPHKKMTERGFVLIPLNEIAPDVVHPLLKQPVNRLLSCLHTTERVRKVKG